MKLEYYHQDTKDGCGNQGSCNVYQPPISFVKAFYTWSLVGENSRSQTMLTFATQQASSIQTTAHEAVQLRIIWESDIESLSIRIVVVEWTSSNDCIIDCVIVTHTKAYKESTLLGGIITPHSTI